MPSASPVGSRLRPHAAAIWVALVWTVTAWVLAFQGQVVTDPDLEAALLPLFLIPALLACEIVVPLLWSRRSISLLRLLRAAVASVVAAALFLLGLDLELRLMLGDEFQAFIAEAEADSYREFFLTERLEMMYWLVPLGGLALFFSMQHAEGREGIP